MTNPILIDKDGVQREISLPFSMWMTRDDVDHLARRIYETLQLWNTYNVEEGWLDIYAIDRGRTKSGPISWKHAANVVQLNSNEAPSEATEIGGEEEDRDPGEHGPQLGEHSQP